MYLRRISATVIEHYWTRSNYTSSVGAGPCKPTFQPRAVVVFGGKPLHRSFSTSRQSRSIHQVSHVQDQDTIFALASGQGRAGIAVIRVSGVQSDQVYFRLCRKSQSTQQERRLPPSHKLVLRNIVQPHTGELLDQAAVIWFPDGQSYTGEPCLELHVHGGSATVRDVLDAVADLSLPWSGSNGTNDNSPHSLSIRPAEPGEFTRRAFVHGRIDLTSSEALHSLITAETSVQRRLALQGAGGLQTKRYEAIRATLLDAMAMVEALIDFSDEDGVEDGTWQIALTRTREVKTLIEAELGIDSSNKKNQQQNEEWLEKVALKKRHVGEILTQGIRLAIYGPPNAGKSSLLNTLADRQAAIVSPIPGTTRDVLQVNLDLDGFKVIAYDTAGIRDDQHHSFHPPSSSSIPQQQKQQYPIDEIETIGIHRAKQAVKEADLSLLVYPLNEPLTSISLLRPDSYSTTQPDLVFFNKSDLVPNSHSSHSNSSSNLLPSGTKTWTGSIQTNQGVSQLFQGLSETIQQTYHSQTQLETPLITQARHRFHLLQCWKSLCYIDSLVDSNVPSFHLVLIAQHLRIATTALSKVTGLNVSVDELLGRIFSTFCIGK